MGAAPSGFTALFLGLPSHTEMNCDVFVCIQIRCYTKFLFPVVPCAMCRWLYLSKLVVYRHFSLCCLHKQQCWAQHQSKKFSFWKRQALFWDGQRLDRRRFQIKSMKRISCSPCPLIIWWVNGFSSKGDLVSTVINRWSSRYLEWKFWAVLYVSNGEWHVWG